MTSLISALVVCSSGAVASTETASLTACTPRVKSRARVRPTFEDECLLLSREAAQRCRDLPSSDSERWQEEATFGIGDPLDDGAAVRMRSRDGDAGKDSARSVPHDPADLTGVVLGEGERRVQRARGNSENETHPQEPQDATAEREHLDILTRSRGERKDAVSEEI